MFDRNPKVSASIEAISELLVTLSPGETATHQMISKAAGLPASRKVETYVLRQAIKKAEDKTGAVFENVFAVGYQRLPSGDIAIVGKKANARIRRHARGTRKRLEGVRENMEPRAMATVAAYRSHFGMIEGLAREQIVSAIEGALDKAPLISPKSIAESMTRLMRKRENA